MPGVIGSPRQILQLVCARLDYPCPERGHACVRCRRQADRYVKEVLQAHGGRALSAGIEDDTDPDF